MQSVASHSAAGPLQRNCVRHTQATFKSWRPSAVHRLQRRNHIQNRSRRCASPQANLDYGTTLAVTQQCGSFIFTILGEALYIRTTLPPGTKGRPPLLLTGAAAAGYAVSLAALNFGGPDGAKVGLGLGTIISAGLLALYIKRTIDTEHDPYAWPGPKAWPASLILVSFFAVSICFQALQKALDPVVVDNIPPLN